MMMMMMTPNKMLMVSFADTNTPRVPSRCKQAGSSLSCDPGKIGNHSHPIDISIIIMPSVTPIIIISIIVIRLFSLWPPKMI